MKITGGFQVFVEGRQAATAREVDTWESDSPPTDSDAATRLMDYLEARGWHGTRRNKDRGLRWFTPPHEDGEVEIGPEVAPDVAARVAELEGRLVEEVEAELRAVGALEP